MPRLRSWRKGCQQQSSCDDVDVTYAQCGLTITCLYQVLLAVGIDVALCVESAWFV